MADSNESDSEESDGDSTEERIRRVMTDGPPVDKDDDENETAEPTEEEEESKDNVQVD